MNQKSKTAFDKIPISQVKTYWNGSPCNLEYSKNIFGTKEYFDEVEEKKYLIEPHIRQFAAFEKWKGKKVLEIGCGMGSDTINFARSGAMVTAVDLSETSLNIARGRAKVYGLEKNIKFYCGNSEELSSFVPPEPYDLIYSFGVIHHTPHPENVIKEIRKFTHPKTVIKIMVYNRFSWPVFWILLAKGRGAFWRSNELIAKYSESQNCPITYVYSPKEARRLLDGFNIKNISIECPPSDANHLRRLYEKSAVWRRCAHPVIKFFGRPFGWHLCVTAEPQ